MSFLPPRQLLSKIVEELRCNRLGEYVGKLFLCRYVDHIRLFIFYISFEVGHLGADVLRMVGGLF